MYDVCNLIDGKRCIANEQDRPVVGLVYLENEIIVVSHNHPICIKRILADILVSRPLPEFWDEVNVLDIVAVVVKAMDHLMFDVFVENKSVSLRSVLGRCE